MEYPTNPSIGIVAIAACIAISTILAVAHPVWFAVAAITIVLHGA